MGPLTLHDARIHLLRPAIDVSPSRFSVDASFSVANHPMQSRFEVCSHPLCSVPVRCEGRIFVPSGMQPLFFFWIFRP